MDNTAVRCYAQELLSKYAPGTQVRDPTLYDRALTHRSANRSECNEQLEYLGDAVLYLAVASYLHTRYPTAREDLLSRVRSNLIRGSTLADLCSRGTRLGTLLRLRKLDTNGPTKSALEDVMEAFLGAVFKDQGFEVAQAWLVGFLEDHVDFAQLIAHQDNPKDVLNRHCKASYGIVPVYEELDGQHTGPVIVRIWDRADGNILATGRGVDRKRAEQTAARHALQFMRHKH
jgi:ribonuclease-3